jgi:hypothetical protein
MIDAAIVTRIENCNKHARPRAFSSLYKYANKVSQGRQLPLYLMQQLPFRQVWPQKLS